VSSCLAVLLISGCATTRIENPFVTDAQEVYSKVESDSNVNNYAPLELKEAQVALENVEKSWETGADPAEIEHLAYLAKQKALIATEVANMKIADKEVETTSVELNKVLLEARTKEAKESLSQAEMARQEAEKQRLSADEALKEAQLQAAEAQKERMEAEKARKEAQLRASEAEKERMEAEKARREAAAAEARTKKLEAQISDLEARQTERGLVLTLGDVLFDTGKSELKAGAQSTIDKLAAFLQEYTNRKVQIEGFTDSVGVDEYNLGLSIRRAEAVRNALNDRGIEFERIKYRGYGEAFPVASNDTNAGRQRNRRVEIIISDENGQIIERTQ
jgi:outer membrane protein OmpA-like peptidoglycan-associated protein